MKSKEAIEKELEKQFRERLQLRLNRKMKCNCRNCKRGMRREVECGALGRQTLYLCSDNKEAYGEHGCSDFECVYTEQSIEEEMLAEIRDPAICGAKEPKIAALLWVLHGEDEGVFAKVKRILGM